MKVAGLFAGIGGLEVGLDRAGHRTVLLCEIDKAACEVLKKHFPEVPITEDIHDLKRLPSEVELVAAGFPCQDLSQAGMTRGLNGTESVLVNEIFRLLKRKRTPHVLLENVSFMLHLHKGQVLRYVIGRLEELGYAWAYRVVDTRSFGIPQRRERVFILASQEIEPWRVLFKDDNPREEDRDHRGKACGFYWTEGSRGLGWAVDAIPTLKGGSSIGIPSPPAIWLPDGRIVTPDIRDAERLQGFEPDWTKPTEKLKRPGYRWKQVGNAVTVHVAEWLGNVINSEPAWEPKRDIEFKDEGPCPKAAFGSKKGGRYRAEVSTYPVNSRMMPLGKYLEWEPYPLSAKATEGFIKRLKASSLSYPDEFLRDLERHLICMRAMVKASPSCDRYEPSNTQVDYGHCINRYSTIYSTRFTRF